MSMHRYASKWMLIAAAIKAVYVERQPSAAHRSLVIWRAFAEPPTHPRCASPGAFGVQWGATDVTLHCVRVRQARRHPSRL